MTIQWHLTDVCNFRCRHCYQSDYTDHGANYQTLLGYYDKIEQFASYLKADRVQFPCHINFTGGEPFLKDELLDLLQIVNSNKIFSFGILSNGYLLSEEKLFLLQSLKPKFIQISIEGNRNINDYIRGQGSYEKIITAIETYKKYNIPVILSFTANSENYKHYPYVVKLARKYNVYKIWTDRYLPYSQDDTLAMSTVQTREFFEILLREQKRKFPQLFSKTIVAADRALQFLVAGGQPYKCSAGVSLLAILPNGDILPCRRLPIKLGNLSADNLIKVYKNSLILENLRSSRNLDEKCKKCYYETSCSGGLKCLSFARDKDYNKKDPNCWISI